MSINNTSNKSFFETSGWDIYPFEAILNDNTRRGAKIKKQDYQKVGNFPIVDQGKSYIAGYTNEKEGLYTGNPVILFGDHTKIIKYVDFPLYLGADGVKLLEITNERACAKYVYYFLKTVKLPSIGYSRHYKYLKDVEIPLPSRSVQRKIVKILDSAEMLIEKRHQQVQELDNLLKNVFYDIFGDPDVINTKYPQKELREFGRIITGNTPSRKDESNFGEAIEWIKSDNIVLNPKSWTKFN
ncbi:hypothetical protein BMT55_03180 [Listeria newyorkensis]|uniref:Type I restriction modification DNA specificity domain-containing protein n=2 Tax=Listeria newyorkensis TaxID=1497681 RepID=A0ABX4XNZ6_9LIST|nr:hypothetical protein EP58_04275 [Listeria newyorkensis]PNP93789.1 hypothetical protein BMT55_03180 [Listeria newyorkensis]